jgi:hypothetical protein
LWQLWRKTLRLKPYLLLFFFSIDDVKDKFGGQVFLGAPQQGQNEAVQGINPPQYVQGTITTSLTIT